MRLETRVLEQSTKSGALLIGLGILMLLSLRFFASPVATTIMNREAPGFVAFLGIPVFFVLTGLGVALFLWEPRN